jgi:hypothetical protein
MKLLSEHREDLGVISGLNDKTIELMRVESVDPSDRLKSLGVQSAYRIPYLELKDCPPFHRDKLFPPLKDADGKTRKYDQPANSCRLYVMEPVVDLLQDFTKPLFIAEGEKKAAAGYQAGLGCVVGIGGVWNFLLKGTDEMIPEFDRIAWRSREIYYIPDSDVWARRDLQDAVYELGAKIRDRGGLTFYFIQIPPGPNGGKRGLDDFLLTESVEALMKLPKSTLGGKGWALQKKALKSREAKRERRQEEPKEEKKEEIPPDLLAAAKLTRDLIAIVRDTIRRFVFIKDDRMYLLISVWILATYIYENFDYFPILWITSPTKRSGKTRLMEVLAQLASRPSGIKVNPSEAILFRITNRGSTLLVDEVEKLKNSDRDLYGAIMAVLNSGFQKGASVSRVQKGKDGVLNEVDYNTYGPKVISGISNVTDTIADRSLAVKMIRRVRRSPAEKIERFRLRKLSSELGGIVLQLKIWAAAKSQTIQAIYDAMDAEPQGLESCDDRFLDIVEPLLTIAAQSDVEYSNGGDRTFDNLVALLKDLGSQREEQGDDATIQCAIETIGEILENQPEEFFDGRPGVFIYSTNLLKALQEKPAAAWIKTTRSLANFLSKLGLFPRPSSGGKKRGYRITRQWFDDLISRYPPYEVSEASEPSQETVNHKVAG